MFALWLTFNPRAKATDIGSLLSSGAVFGGMGVISHMVPISFLSSESRGIEKLSVHRI